MANKQGFYRHALLSVLVLLLVLGSAGFAFAAEDEPQIKFSMRGDVDISFSGVEGATFSTKSKNDVFSVAQRFRFLPTITVTDEFSIHALLRIKPDRWGDNTTTNSGYNMDGDGNIFITRFLFANWRPIDKTTVHMGIINMALPVGAYRNGVLDTSFGGVSVNYAFDKGKNIILGWGRAYDNTERTTMQSKDDTDIFVAMLPMTFEEPSIYFAPWAVYANIGRDSRFWQDRVAAVAADSGWQDRNVGSAGKVKYLDDDGRGVWAGFAAKWDNGPFALKGDFAYGQIKTDESPMGVKNNYNTSGWFAAIKAEYRTSFGVPSLFGWYATGSDADDVRDKQKWGVLPSISTFGDGFAPTSLGFKGGASVNSDGLLSWLPSGKWGVGAEVSEINFVEDLSHVVRVAYYRGTNDNELAGSTITSNPRQNLASATRDNVLMVKGDYIVEVNFDHTYKFSKMVDLNLALGYMNIHRAKEWGDQRDIDDVYAGSLGFTFKF